MPPSGTKYFGQVDGHIVNISHVQIDCPLVGMEVWITKDGRVYVNVDGNEVLHVKNGSVLMVRDDRTGYKHEATTGGESDEEVDSTT